MGQQHTGSCFPPRQPATVCMALNGQVTSIQGLSLEPNKASKAIRSMHKYPASLVLFGWLNNELLATHLGHLWNNQNYVWETVSSKHSVQVESND